MDLVTLFSAYPGTHVVQAFFHSLTAAVIADRAIGAWGIRSPLVTQKFHLIAVFAPVFSYPLYQWLNPERGSIDFRLGALFDSQRWLNLDVWGVPAGAALLVLLLLATTAIFVLQELIPILRHESGPHDAEAGMGPPGAGSPVAAALQDLAARPPGVIVVEDDDPVIHSVTSGSPTIYLTTGLVEVLEPDELRAALAHEIAHVRRSRRSLLILAYLMRVALFFSPGTLVAFRKAADEEEKICDDWAAQATGRPAALAAALEKLRHGSAYDVEERSPGEALRTIERMSYDLMVRERIRRLEQGESARPARGDWLKLAATVAAVVVVNYYVV